MAFGHFASLCHIFTIFAIFQTFKSLLYLLQWYVMCSFKNFTYLSIFDCAGSSVLCGLFSSCSKPGLLFLTVHGLLTAVASLIAKHRLQHLGFSSCGMWLSSCSSWALEHRFSSRVLGLDCSVACGIFPDQYWIHASCIGKWILYHWIIREAQ